MKNTLENLKIQAREEFIPIIREKSGLFLQEQIRKSNPQKVLEIGTAIGYSGSLILSACDCHLTTIEKNEQLHKRACKTFEELGLSNRVCAICGDAKEVLNELVKQDEKFDFIFLDGPKGQYVKYFPFCKTLLNAGGTLFADNINHDGLVFQNVKPAHKNRTMIVNLRKFVEMVNADKDFDTQIYDFEDGIMLAKAKIKNF